MSLARFRFEVPLLALAICAIGIVYIHSASFDAGAGAYKPYAATQARWLAIGLAGFFAALAVPYRTIERHVWLIYAGAIALLAGVHIFGTLINGARSWYDVGPARLQPSEFAKLAVICAVASALKRQRDVRGLRPFALVAAVAGPPLLSILREPDFGTVLVFAPALLAMLFVAGAPLRAFGALIGGGAAAVFAAYHLVFDTYQRRRIDVFLDPSLDPRGAGYHTTQARIAIGSGGVLGAGWGEGSQTQMHVLPEAHTDFIFAVIGEEGGLLVAAALLALVLALLLACLDVAWRTREPFGRLVAVGIASVFAAQTAVNCGMTVGLAPVTGITLPLVSYGGSSLVSAFVALGLVANIALRAAPHLGRDFRSARPRGPGLASRPGVGYNSGPL